MQASATFVHEPDPDHPGWCTWELSDSSRFNTAVLGRMIVRPEGERGARVRMLAMELRHSNLQDNVHGGVTLAFIDVSMFATIFSVLGIDAAESVTLDLSCQFVGAGKISEPLDAVGEVMKETGRLVFLRGTVEQSGTLVASYIGTVRKPSKR